MAQEPLSKAFSRLCLRSPRLILRPFRATDFTAWAKASRERLQPQNEFDKGPPPSSALSQETFLDWRRKMKKAQDRDFLYTLAVFHKRTGENLGLVNFAVIARLSYQFGNLGYELNNQFWGQGFATEAVKAAIPVAFRVLKLQRIEAGIEPHNRTSLAVAEKVGMKREGLREKYFFDGQTWIDLIYYSLRAQEAGFRQAKPSVRPELREFL